MSAPTLTITAVQQLNAAADAIAATMPAHLVMSLELFVADSDDNRYLVSRRGQGWYVDQALPSSS